MQFGVIFAQLSVASARLGADWRYLCPTYRNLGSTWLHLGSNWWHLAQLFAILAQLGGISVQSGGLFPRLSWAVLAPLGFQRALNKFECYSFGFIFPNIPFIFQIIILIICSSSILSNWNTYITFKFVLRELGLEPKWPRIHDA